LPAVLQASALICICYFCVFSSADPALPVL
jgi:hypothetical protein